MEYRVDIPRVPGGWGTVYLDPPWPAARTKRYACDTGTGIRRPLRYDRMSEEALQRMPIPDILSPDAHVYCWTPNSHLAMAIHLLEYWGLTYKTNVCWSKLRPSGKQFLGLGWFVRNAHELCLLAVKSIKKRRNPGSTRSIMHEVFRGHSCKPEKMYEIIEKLSPGPYLEIFSRTSGRPGWVQLISDQKPKSTYDDGTINL